MTSKKQKETPAVYKPIANGIAPPQELMELQNKVQAGVPLTPFETKRSQLYNYIGALLSHAEAMRVWRMEHLKQYVTLLPAMQLEQAEKVIVDAAKEGIVGPN